MTLADKARDIWINAREATLEADFAAMNKLLKGHEDDRDACAYLEGLALMWSCFRPGKPMPGSEAAKE